MGPKQKFCPLELNHEALNVMIINKTDFKLVDIREENERPLNSPGLNIPLSKLLENPELIPKDQPIILYCQTGFRSKQAAQMLRTHFQSDQIFSLEGGYRSMTQENDPSTKNLFPK